MRRASLVAIFVTVFLDLLGFGLVVPYLPGVARDTFHATDLQATLLGSAYSVMQLVFVPYWGQLSDRVGRRPVLVGSAAASIAGFLLLGRASSLWMLFAARVWTGISTSNLSVAQAYIADVTGPRDRTRGMSIIGAALGTGFVLGPVLGGLLEGASPLPPGALPAYAGAALALLNTVLALAFLPESHPPEKRGAVRRASPFDLERYRVALRFPGTAPALVFNFVVTLSFVGMEITFRLFTRDEFGMTVRDTSMVLGFVGLVLIVTQGGVLPRLSRVLGERALVRIGVLLEAAGFLAVAFSPRAGPVGLYAAMGTMALGSAITAPSLAAFVSRGADADCQGIVMGVLQSSGAFARVCGPALAGLLYGSVAHRAPYLAGAAGMLLGGALTFLLRRDQG